MELDQGLIPICLASLQNRRAPVGGNNAKSVGPLLLNPEAFQAPRGLTFGNAGRNDLNNPRRWNTDVAMLKHFAMPHETNLEFRAEAFNLFNATPISYLRSYAWKSSQQHY